jgi:hypothetical protein
VRLVRSKHKKRAAIDTATRRTLCVPPTSVFDVYNDDRVRVSMQTCVLCSPRLAESVDEDVVSGSASRSRVIIQGL